MNEEDIDKLVVTITNNSAALDSISLDWDADDDLFLTEDSEIVMPGFEAVKLSFGGLNLPAQEEIAIENGDEDYIMLRNFPLKESTDDIPFLYSNTTHILGIGKDADELLLTDVDGNMTWNSSLHDWFVASYNDGSDSESYLMRVTNFDDSDDVNKTTFQYKKGKLG